MSAFVFPENPTEGLEVELPNGRSIVFSNGRWSVKNTTTAITLPHVPEYGTPERDLSTPYQNTGNTVRYVIIGITSTDRVDFTATVDGNTVAICKAYDADGNVSTGLTLSFPVPPGSTYVVTPGAGNLGTVSFWNEFQ